LADFDNPSDPNNTYLASNSRIDLTIPNVLDVKRISYLSDYYPMSFFGLKVDFNPYGASISFYPVVTI